MPVLYHKTFYHSLGALEKQDRKAVLDKLMRFSQAIDLQEEIPGGLRLHPVGPREKRVYSLSANLDLRILLRVEGDSLLVLWVDHHDAAYRWLERHEVQVNPVSRGLQIFAAVADEETTQPASDEEARRDHPRPFAEQDPQFLMLLGVPEPYVDWVRNLPLSRLLEVIDRVPEEVAERLLDLAQGQEVSVPAPAPEDRPLEHPDIQSNFRLLEGDPDLEQALEGGWDAWTRFLHPSQRALVEGHYRGPFRVSGGPGTGKTVVALHRAAFLARKHPGARILLTAYSRTLAERMREQFGHLVPRLPGVPYPVEIGTLHSTALELSRLRWKIVSSDWVIPELLRLAYAEVRPADFSEAFVQNEWQTVVEPYGLWTFAEYREARRPHKGTPLGARGRLALWKVFERVLARLEEKQETTFGHQCSALAAQLEASGEWMYDHIVIDEAQDMGPAELRLVQALVRPGENSLFFCADAGQRIFRGAVSWLTVGLDMRGRARRLKLNYRTTSELLVFAEDLLTGTPPQEDEVQDRLTLSRRHGPVPQVCAATDLEGEVRAVVEWLRARHAEGIPYGRMAVLERKKAHPYAKRVAEELGVPLFDAAEATLPALDALVTATLHRAKGLEFQAVVVMGVQEGLLPLPRALEFALDKPDETRILETERQLLYVAVTRAREHLLVSYSGTPSRFLHPRSG